jgi:DNA-binding NarL/FixJ family response regulator
MLASMTILMLCNEAIFVRGLSSLVTSVLPAVSLTGVELVEDALLLMKTIKYDMIIVSKDGDFFLSTILMRQIRNMGFLNPVIVLTELPVTKELIRYSGFLPDISVVSKKDSEVNIVGCIASKLQSKLESTVIQRVDRPLPFFSKRELEILKLMAQDFDNEKMAETLFLSVRTVESHKRNMLEKTGMRSSVGLVVLAIRQGWVLTP